MQIQITKVEPGQAGPVGKLADVEIVLDSRDGLLAGLKLVGFAVWDGDGDRKVTVPTRIYTVAGDRRQFEILRPAFKTDDSARERLCAAILAAYDHPEGVHNTGHIDALNRPIYSDRYGRREWQPGDDDKPKHLQHLSADEWYRMRQVHGPVSCG